MVDKFTQARLKSCLTVCLVKIFQLGEDYLYNSNKMKTLFSNLISKRFSRKGLWSLFLICAFPLHAWTLILAFSDFSWVAERTNSWDALGVVSYGLIFALIESVIVFLVAVLLGLLVSTKWREEQRISLMSNLVLIASLWAMIGQLFFIWEVRISGQIIDFLVGLNHPLRFIYLVSLSAIGFSVLAPTYLIFRSNRFLRFTRELFERLSLLTLFYLLFDFIGLMIVVSRNI